MPEYTPSMARVQQQRRINADLPVAVVSVVLFIGWVLLLRKATRPVVAALDVLSGGNPYLYAAGVALLAGAPGLLWVLPRALRRPDDSTTSHLRRRRQVSARRPSHTVTDVLGVAALLLAQVPLPAPWGPSGKAATVANVTMSAQIVELSERFATLSLVVAAAGVAAVVLVTVHGRVALHRVLGIALVAGAPVVAWLVAVRAIA